MHFEEFADDAMRTAHFQGFDTDLIHSVLGLTSESGELADAVKKVVAYKQDLDVANVIEELGDILWFVAFACKTLDLPMSFPAALCIEKLQKRYPDKFSIRNAIERADKQ